MKTIDAKNRLERNLGMPRCHAKFGSSMMFGAMMWLKALSLQAEDS